MYRPTYLYFILFIKTVNNIALFEYKLCRGHVIINIEGTIYYTAHLRKLSSQWTNVAAIAKNSRNTGYKRFDVPMAAVFND